MCSVCTKIKIFYSIFHLLSNFSYLLRCIRAIQHFVIEIVKIFLEVYLTCAANTVIFFCVLFPQLSSCVCMRVPVCLRPCYCLLHYFHLHFLLFCILSLAFNRKQILFQYIWCDLSPPYIFFSI